MNTCVLIPRLLSIITLCLLNAVANAASNPVWTFTPLTATTLSVPSTRTATVKYQVTNQSSKTHTLAMNPIAGITPIISAAGDCPNPFTLGFNQSCTLNLLITGGLLQGDVRNGPMVCEKNSIMLCNRPSVADSLDITLIQTAPETSLAVSTSELALSVTGLEDTNSGFTGVSGIPRNITITNTGPNPAGNLTINEPTWPSGTTTSTTCTSTLPAGDSCEITITPGSIATSDDNLISCDTAVPVTAPVPGIIEIQTDNAPTLSTSVVVLGYGCIYQGGALFSVTETTDIAQSIGGKVTTLENGYAGPWGPTDVLVGGIGVDSTASPTSCNGKSDGACNTARIVAAGLVGQVAGNGCAALDVAGFDNWYLPAICEMGYDGSSTGNGCGTLASPFMQNLYTNLKDKGVIPTAAYWASTESSIAGQAWSQNVTTGLQRTDYKGLINGARCVRTFNDV